MENSPVWFLKKETGKIQIGQVFLVQVIYSIQTVHLVQEYKVKVGSLNNHIYLHKKKSSEHVQ
jgi:hypothetical protein